MAATVPSGFLDSIHVQLPADATAMQFTPDGRLFVCQQGGRLRVVRSDGTLLATPFVTLSVDATGERGLLGVAFDPDFGRNHFVYVYYTAKSPTIHNRVSRFTANGNLAVPGSEVVLLELIPCRPRPSITAARSISATTGGFTSRSVTTPIGSNAQSLGNVFGKVLRINRDGSIPADNPFVGRTTGVSRSIWALGLRNPFTMAVSRNTGRLFINDVGYNRFEEINQGRWGANYGWPSTEGPSTDTSFTNPIHSYSHAGAVCAITGGAFYEPDVAAFPAWNFGQYFFADYCAGWIRRYDPSSRIVNGFATGIRGPVDLKVGPDGALYYLARNAGYVGRISYSTAQPPVIQLQPASRTIGVGQSATFKVGATGSAPLAYQWRRNGVAIAGATYASYTRNNVQLVDNGAFFDVVVTNRYGRAVSNAAQLTVLQNAAPTASITQPQAGTTYAGGNVVSYAGTGNDLRGRHLARERVHLVGQPAPRRPHAPGHACRHRSEVWVVHDPGDGRDIRQCVLPHPSARARLGGADPLGDSRPATTQSHDHVGSQSLGPATEARWSARGDAL